MPLSFEGLEVSEEIQAKLNEQYEKDVGSVANKNTELLGKIKTAKDAAIQSGKDKDAAELAASESAMSMAKDNETWIAARDANAKLIQDLKDRKRFCN